MAGTVGVEPTFYRFKGERNEPLYYIPKIGAVYGTRTHEGFLRLFTKQVQ